ncbi:MAG: hypothetical protein M1825_003898 [Sarcosagium campestre]|nr:MAG: hypothetical protein M1825_003898 [Sarcosagium campestre]
MYIKNWNIVVFSALIVFLSAIAVSTASSLTDEIARASNQSLLWGPYRPNLYFGVRPRIPHSLTTALLWAKVDSFQSAQERFRYTCEQNEGMAGYGWDEYDVRRGGRQTIHDAGNDIDIQTDFVKKPGGVHGGSWGVRVTGTPREDAPLDLKTTLVFSVAMEGDGSVGVAEAGNAPGADGNVMLKGSSPELGGFTIDVTTGPGSNVHPEHSHASFADKPLHKTFVQSFNIAEDSLWRTKNILFAAIKQQIDLYVQRYGADDTPPPCQLYTIPHKPGPGNQHLVQKVFEGAFEFDILFSSDSAPSRLTSEGLTHEIGRVAESTPQRFLRLLSPRAPFNQSKYQAFSRSLFSNLIGGIGYFSGDAIVDRSYAPEYDEDNEGFWEEAAEARALGRHRSEGPYQLFTSIPSRPFFPRGFLWDEGFHLLPVLDWDVDLGLDIVRSWLGLMDDDGWIAREQILGPEARSKVPEEFQVQYPHYANPPTLFLVLDAFLDKLDSLSSSSPSSSTHSSSTSSSTVLDSEAPPANANDAYDAHLANPEAASQYLREMYPRLRRYYLWFRKTQTGDVRSWERNAFSTREAYRWRGRTPAHILTSGLDDYPRAQPPHTGELHVDLLAWVGTMARSMARIARTLGDEPEDALEFGAHEAAIRRNIDDLHWNGDKRMYCDASIDDYDESVHVCHRGYVSLFPFLLGLLPQSAYDQGSDKHKIIDDEPNKDGDDKGNDRLAAILDLIADPKHLWSEHGIRSLSRADPLYGTAENYWRSPVWININYLVLVRLLEVAKGSGIHKQRASAMYSALRVNLVRTVYTQWRETGFAWEQYNAETGKGQRTQHFTGWTSLVVLIMKMPSLDDSSDSHYHHSHHHDEL